MLAGIGSMPALVPPQMIEIEAVGAIASLWLKRSMTPRSAASGQGPRSAASLREAASHWRRRVLKRRMFQHFAMALSNGTFWLCRNEWKPIRPRPTDRSRWRVDGVAHLRRRADDEVLQHVVEEAHDVLDEGRVVAPLQEGLGVDRGQAADRGALQP
jgi:hypothetical protein